MGDIAFLNCHFSHTQDSQSRAQDIHLASQFMAANSQMHVLCLGDFNFIARDFTGDGFVYHVYAIFSVLWRHETFVDCFFPRAVVFADVSSSPRARWRRRLWLQMTAATSFRSPDASLLGVACVMVSAGNPPAFPQRSGMASRILLATLLQRLVWFAGPLLRHIQARPRFRHSA